MIESDNLEWFKRTYPVAYEKAMKRNKSNQTFMGEVAKRPAGMPDNAAIRNEILRMGLTAADADDTIDRWRMNGFRTKTGPIRDWKAALRIYQRNGWFPSQKNSKDQTEEDRARMSKEMKELRKIHDDNGDRRLL